VVENPPSLTGAVRRLKGKIENASLPYYVYKLYTTTIITNSEKNEYKNDKNEVNKKDI